MVLEQDKAQASQAADILAERQYKKDLAKYETDLAEYEKNKAAIEEADRKEKEALEKVKQDEIARLKAEQKARDDEKRRIEAAINAYREQYWRRYPHSKGSSANVAINKYAFKLRGGTEAEWNEKRRIEEQNRKISQRQSAGLRASGNAAIKAAQEAELARLGGGTKVSATLGTDSRITDKPVAKGEAAKAQDFGQGFTYETRFYGYSTTGEAEVERVQKIAEYERQQANQATLRNLGLAHDIEQLNQLGVSSVYNADILQVPEPPEQVNTKPMMNKQEKYPDRNLVAEYMIPPKERSNIGYSPEGKPYVGAVKPEPEKQLFDYKIKLGAGSTERLIEPIIPISSMTQVAALQKPKQPSGETYWEVETKEGAKQFATEKEAKEFIESEQRANLNPRQQRIDLLLQGLEKAEQYKPENPILRQIWQSTLAYPIGSAKSAVAAVASLDNLITKHVTKEDQIPIPRTGDEVLLPISIEDGLDFKLKTSEEIIKDTKEYVKKYSPDSFLGGVASTYIPIGQGAYTVGKTGVRLVSKAAAKTLSKSPRLIDAVIQSPKEVSVIKTPQRSIKSIYEDVSYNPPAEKIIVNPYAAWRETSTSLGKSLVKKPKGVTKAPDYNVASQQFQDFQSSLQPKRYKVVGEIKLSKDFIPNKPKSQQQINFEKAQEALKKGKPVEPDPYMTKAERPERARYDKLDYEALLGRDTASEYPFKSETIRIGTSEVKKPKITKSPDYNIASQAFQDFQKSITSTRFKPTNTLTLGTSLIRRTKSKTPDYNLAAQAFQDFQKSITSTRFKPTNKISMGTTSMIKKVRGRSKTPDYIIASPEFVNFQQSLTGTKRYSKVSRDIKTSKDFIPLSKTRKKPYDRFEPRKFREPEGTSRGGLLLVQKTKKVVKTQTRKAQARDIRTRRSGSITKNQTKITGRTKSKSKTVMASIPKQSSKTGIKSKEREALLSKTSVSAILKSPAKEKAKERQIEKQIHKYKTPSEPKPRTKQLFKPKFPVRLRQKQRIELVPKKPKKQKAVAIFLDNKSKDSKITKKGKKTDDFLQSSKLHDIEGMFNRDVLYGEKKVTKQIRKDKKAKFLENKVKFFA